MWDCSKKRSRVLGDKDNKANNIKIESLNGYDAIRKQYIDC